MKYQIELTENQARIVQIALEEYFRLRLGQEFEFVTDLAGINVDFSRENPNHDEIFNMYILTRNNLQEIMRSVFHIAFGHYGTPVEKTDDMMDAECIWDAIRFARGRSRWDNPLQIGTEPSPKIVKIEEGE